MLDMAYWSKQSLCTIIISISPTVAFPELLKVHIPVSDLNRHLWCSFLQACCTIQDFFCALSLLMLLTFQKKQYGVNVRKRYYDSF
uniref:Uncharacterized protein n=1 Tax=Pyxicephalus adspersus TaxID=30357 RepID=A0AAV3ADH0_PYXAD|nr:TPA: hypothetical protein GDO54_013255 [Pyxicephalus adspersus]